MGRPILRRTFADKTPRAAVQQLRATGARVSFIALTDSAILAEQVGQAAATPSANGKKPGV
jgi:hypothetical protein